MDRLNDILREEVELYAGIGANCYLFPLLDDKHQTYGINSISYPVRKRPAGVVLLARIQDDKIIIEEDRTDKPLLEALLQRGIPREQIILAYAGESIPAIETS